MRFVWKHHYGMVYLYGLRFRGWFVGFARDFRMPGMVFKAGHFDHFEDEEK